MKEVLAANEEAYKKRFGISLNKIWHELSEEQREHYQTEAEVYIKAPIPQGYRFESEEILRIVIGYRNSEQIRCAFENAVAPTRLLLWEPDEAVFIAGCVYEDLTQYINDDRINIALGSGEDILKRALGESVSEHNLMHRHIYAYGEYLKPDNEHVELFLKVFEKFYYDMASQMHFRKQYEHRVYENVLYTVNVLNDNSTIDQLFETIPTRDIPVIIVAAGPSLMKNCRELKRAKGRAIIVAVAHSMKTLAREGIRPDIVATTDPKSPFFLDFDKKRDYNLLCCVYVNRVFQEAYNGKLIFYGFPMFRELFSSKRTDSEITAELDTGSVATDILSLFIAAGFKRFILVGQDLAYNDEGLSHTEVQMEIRKKDEKGIFPETDGINGGKVRTRDDWQLFREYYEKRINSDETLEIIDATEGGALIHGSKVMTLSDAIDEYCKAEYQVDDWIAGIQKGDVEEKCYIDEWFTNQIEMNQRTEINLDRIIALNEEITAGWNNTHQWNDEYSAKCRSYDIIYHVIMEGTDGAPLREYCRADLERYIEDALIYEGDNNIESRMKREYDLFVLMRDKLAILQEFIREIRFGDDKGC